MFRRFVAWCLCAAFLWIDVCLCVKCGPDTCELPRCSCASRFPPRGMPRDDMPQIVTISFDDQVTDKNMEYYRLLFTKDRLNQNGCPIQATFFVSDDDGTNYEGVRELYLSGHEIASHSLTHREPSSWWAHASYDDWRQEIVGMRQKLAREARIPPREVRGMRAPFLELGSDRQFLMLRDHGFLYDSSFMTGPLYENDPKLPVWPFTLDFPPTLEFCDSIACPRRNFSGIWEIPLNRWIGNDGHSCPMADACATQGLNTKRDVLRYLWKNFRRHYSHKTPFGMHLHTTWFEDSWKLEAVDEFIQSLTARKDVYLVTMHELLMWMQNLTTLNELPNFEPWKTSCNKGRVLLSNPTAAPKLRRTRPPRPATSGPRGLNPSPGLTPRRSGFRPSRMYGRRTQQPSRMVTATAREYPRMRPGRPASGDGEHLEQNRPQTRYRKPPVEEQEMPATSTIKNAADSRSSPKRPPLPTRRPNQPIETRPSLKRDEQNNTGRNPPKPASPKPHSKPSRPAEPASRPQPSSSPPRRPPTTENEPDRRATAVTPPRRPPPPSTARDVPSASTVGRPERPGPQAGSRAMSCGENGVCVPPPGGNLRSGGASLQGRRQLVRSGTAPLASSSATLSIALAGIAAALVPMN